MKTTNAYFWTSVRHGANLTLRATADFVRQTASSKRANLLHFITIFIPIFIAVSYLQHIVLGRGDEPIETFVMHFRDLLTFQNAGLVATALFVGLTSTLALHVLIMDWAHRPFTETTKDGKVRRNEPRQPQYIEYISSHAGTLLTSFGILGTFVGLALGTANFHGKDTQLAELMLSLSVAFWSSVFGLSWALVLKLMKGLFSRKSELVDDVVSGLRTINHTAQVEAEDIRKTIRSTTSKPLKRLSSAVEIGISKSMDRFSKDFEKKVRILKKEMKTAHEQNLAAQKAQAEIITEGMLGAGAVMEAAIADAAEVIRAANEHTSETSSRAAERAQESYEKAAELFERQIELTRILVKSIRQTDMEYARHAEKLGQAVQALNDYADQFEVTAVTTKQWTTSLKDLGKASKDIKSLAGYISRTVEQQNRALKKIAGERAEGIPHGYDPNNLGHLAASINGVSRRIEQFLQEFGEQHARK